MNVRTIEAKSVLVRSKLPDAEYGINPYTGCAFGCRYCYASFTGRFVEQPLDAWGDYVYAKVNAVEIFTAELERLRNKGQAPSLLLSSVTDPYRARRSSTD
jgi:DNA repair photolyase